MTEDIADERTPEEDVLPDDLRIVPQEEAETWVDEPVPPIEEQAKSD